MGKYSRLGKNTLFVFIGNVGGKALAILMLPLFTRWLSVADFGVTDMIMTYATLLFSFASLSICESAFIFPKGQDTKKQAEYFTSGLVCTLLVFAIIAVFIFLCESLFSLTESENVLLKYRWFIYFVIFAMYIENYFQQFTRSIDKIKTYSFAGIVQSLCIIAFSFVFIPRYGVWGYVLTWATAYSLTGLYSFLFSGSYRYFSLSAFSKSRYWEMLKYSLPLIPNGMMFWMMNSMNRPIMENSLGIDAVGIYALANKFPIILATIFNIFLLSWQISVLEEYKKEGFEIFFNRMLRIVMLGLGFVFIVISIFNKFIIEMTATKDYMEAYKYISILTFGSLIFSLSAFVSSIFLATKESKFFLYSSAIGASVAGITNIILIPRYGIFGAAVAIILSSTAMLLVRCFFVSNHVKIKQSLDLILTMLIYVLITYVVLFDGVIKWLLTLGAVIFVGVINRHYINIFVSFVKHRSFTNLS